MAKLKGEYMSGAPHVDEPELRKKVIAVLEKKGYELPDLTGHRQHAAFIEKHRYDPKVVIASTMQMAKTFADWKKRISPAPTGEEDEED